MKLEVHGNHSSLHDRAARKIAKALRPHSGIAPRLALLAAAGNTPIATYARLVQLKEELTGKRGEFDTSAMTVFALDDYWGIPDGDERSFAAFLEKHLIKPLGLRADQFVRFDLTVGADEAIAKYDAAVKRAGGFDVSVLGLGVNGHVGFNEPMEFIPGVRDHHHPSAEALSTRVVTLTPETRHHNAAYFGGDLSRVPTLGITCGLGHLLSARQTMLLATGSNKHAPFKAAYCGGKPTPAVPASYIAMGNNVLALVDNDVWPHHAVSRPSEERRKKD